MRISHLTITGMHNVTYATYDFNTLSYLFGKNGAGKSTVMQAIQLALLGYIPGTDKNKTAIFRHANGGAMSVYVQLDNKTSVLRRWENTGKDIKASVQLVPETLDLNAVLAELELPIFNFNEFAGMTANKLKDWFINFLPKSEVDIDWATQLRTAYPLVDSIQDGFVDNTIATIQSFDGGQLDKVRKFNELCKMNVSQYKAEVARLTDTMQSLVHYDDSTNVTTSVVENDIKSADIKLQVIRNKMATYNKNAEMLRTMEVISNETGASSEEEFYCKLDVNNTQIQEYKLKIAELNATVTALQEEISGYKAVKASLDKVLNSKGICPFTNQSCDTMANKITDIQSEYETLLSMLDKATRKYTECYAQSIEMTNAQQKLMSDTEVLKSKCDTYSTLVKTVDKSLADTNMAELEQEEADVVAELQKLRDILVKKQANAKYEELMDKVTKDSMLASQLLEVYKAWDKLSGVNGLQTAIMEAPFTAFSAHITKYLEQFFEDTSNPDVLMPTIEAAFHVGEKANSFSFGLKRGGKYVEYDMLSSGEKCLYTLSLLMAITENSSSELKLIMVDDLLDHLDDNRVETCFKTLYNCKDIQIIVAGVKACNIAEADEFVVQI